ncbi:chorismate--pyruvate lyase family protein [Aliikangiella maris]|uniref:Chorismate lyase n=2 Tax=Aliikangiella maris TaxID=3162458 RepID=A0ABV3MS17_9GAMM
MNPKTFALLCDRGSLTERFKQLMGVTPRLTRLSQRMEFVDYSERKQLNIQPRELALVREIKMGKGKQQWLYARTVVPIRTLSGPARRIVMLNNTPIGKILFGRNGAVRKNMDLELTNQIPNAVFEMGISVNHKLWRRSSIFEFSSGPLMVSEIFLPDCPVYAD